MVLKRLEHIILYVKCAQKNYSTPELLRDVLRGSNQFMTQSSGQPIRLNLRQLRALRINLSAESLPWFSPCWQVGAGESNSRVAKPPTNISSIGVDPILYYIFIIGLLFYPPSFQSLLQSVVSPQHLQHQLISNFVD